VLGCQGITLFALNNDALIVSVKQHLLKCHSANGQDGC